MSSTFMKAKLEHAAVKDAATVDAAAAGDLWAAIIGADVELVPGSYAEAVRDTLPEKYEGLILTDDIAAAFAFAIHWAQRDRLPEMATTNAGPWNAQIGSWARRDVAREGWEFFAKRADRIAEVEQGFGWDCSAAWSSAQAIEISRGDFSQVERVAKLAGRMYAALRGARATKVPGIAGEVYSVEQGRAIDRLLPSTLALLSEPALEPVVLEQLATRRAPQYAVRGTQKRSKGPLVVAIDESGSMAGPRNEWAKAAAVAIARVASEEGRLVSVVHFSTSAQRQALRPKDAPGVVEMIQRFLNGGTKIALALDVSADEIRTLATQGNKGADVILITDGIDGDESGHCTAIAACQALDARLWTVAIEADIPECYSLRSRAVSYVRLGDERMNDASTICLFAGAA